MELQYINEMNTHFACVRVGTYVCVCVCVLCVRVGVYSVVCVRVWPCPWCIHHDVSMK